MTYDVLIIGGGPAGLSAAMVLARCRRSVVVVDHGKPRNLAATAVHGFLGRDGIAPCELRRIGRAEAHAYGVEFIDAEATGAECRESAAAPFVVELDGRESLAGRKILLTTGVLDQLPEIENVGEFYGKSVHHCPYCDGWEHRDQRLAALGDGSAAVKLAFSLRTWSGQVTACTNGGEISAAERMQLAANGVDLREEKPRRLHGQDGVLLEVHFTGGPPLPCDALFFADEQRQRSKLPEMLGCESDDGDLIRTEHKHRTCVDGVFVAGDADGDVQFAIVAAAEGAIAATAINRELQEEDRK